MHWLLHRHAHTYSATFLTQRPVTFEEEGIHQYEVLPLQFSLLVTELPKRNSQFKMLQPVDFNGSS